MVVFPEQIYTLQLRPLKEGAVVAECREAEYETILEGFEAKSVTATLGNRLWRKLDDPNDTYINVIPDPRIRHVFVRQIEQGLCDAGLKIKDPH